MIVPVILSGGSGTRLWPVSRQLFPKQLMPMTGEDHSLFQSTILRVETIPDAGAPIVVCNESHRFMVASQMQEIDSFHGDIILEPFARNTAPAVALAALCAHESDPTLLILPADHHITDRNALLQAVATGLSHAKAGKLVTFGIIPTKPETGYGYIKGENISDNDALNIVRFVEKPNETATKRYLEDGSYFWNSGMFMFKASTYLEELKKFAPEIFSSCRTALEKGAKDLDFTPRCRIFCSLSHRFN